MSTLKVISGDLIFFNGDLSFLKGTNSDEEILQRIQTRFKFFKNEWFLNISHGMPYFQEILGTKNLNINILDSIVKTQLLDIEGVKEILKTEISYDKIERKVNISFKVLSINSTKIISDLIIF